MFKLLKFLRPYLWHCLFLVLATGLQVYSTLRLPALMSEVINDGITASDSSVLTGIALQMLGLTLVGALGSIVSSFLSAFIGANFSRDLRAAVFAKVLSFDISSIHKFSTASLITRTNGDVGEVQRTITMMLSMMLRAPLFCILGLVMAFRTAANMTWIIALSVTILIVIISIIITLVLPKFSVYQKLVDRLTAITRENLTGLRVIRAFNNQKLEQKKFERTNREMLKTIIFLDRIMELIDPIMTAIFNGATLLVYIVGISYLETDISYLGNTLAFSQYVTHITMSFFMLSILFVTIPRANVSARRINEVLEAKPSVKWPERTSGTPAKTASVEFKNVSFRYGKAEEEVLSNITFRAEEGTTTAFIGSTGSGKSTLINLIPRFYDVSSGEILVDNINVKDYSKSDLMSKIGLVPQKGVLFAGTVKSNIKFGAPNATDEEVESAAKISESYEFIENLPKKFDSHISQGGTNVSGGQKQRLSIARAIAKNPDIYIFDDSFSALDMKTDQKVRENLKMITKNSVVLIVAQRISTIKNADQIVVLNQGRLVGKGTHSELLRSCEVYREIAESQFSPKEYETELEKAGAVETLKKSESDSSLKKTLKNAKSSDESLKDPEILRKEAI